MRVLLTGATGFIGRHVSRKLEKDGVDFVTLGRGEGKKKQKHVKVDLLETRNFRDIVSEAGATHLIHLAWYAEHGKYWSSPLNIDWIKASVGLIESFCASGGQHVTVSGTCAEYDWDYGYLTEEITPTNPVTIYGIAKDTTRKICETVCSTSGVPLAWGRIFYPYGNGESENRLLPSLAAAFAGKRAAFGVNAESCRDFLHVSDVANALVTLSKSRISGTVNISSGEAVRIRYIVELMARLNSASPYGVLSLSSARSNDPYMLVGNNDRLRKIGWIRRVELTEGLKDYQLRDPK